MKWVSEVSGCLFSARASFQKRQRICHIVWVLVGSPRTRLYLAQCSPRPSRLYVTMIPLPCLSCSSHHVLHVSASDRVGKRVYTESYFLHDCLFREVYYRKGVIYDGKDVLVDKKRAYIHTYILSLAPLSWFRITLCIHPIKLLINLWKIKLYLFLAPVRVSTNLLLHKIASFICGVNWSMEGSFIGSCISY